MRCYWCCAGWFIEKIFVACVVRCMRCVLCVRGMSRCCVCGCVMCVMCGTVCSSCAHCVCGVCCVVVRVFKLWCCVLPFERSYERGNQDAIYDECEIVGLVNCKGVRFFR